MKHKIKLEIISIQDEGFHIFFNAKVNNRDARFLIDTGASRSVLDKAFVNTLEAIDIKTSEILSTGIGSNTLESEFTHIQNIVIDDFELNDVEMAVIDLSHVNQTYKLIGMPDLNGVIGGDILMEHEAIINYKKALLRLNKKKVRKKKKIAVVETIDSENIAHE
jgi:predicted aspartyl protease